MTAEANKAVVLRLYEEVLTRGALAALDQIAAADILDHGMVQAGYPRALATFRQHLTAIRSAFPDLRATVDELIAEGDTVVAIWTMTGTHRAAWPAGFAPTGKVVSLTNVSRLRLRGGQIAEYRVFSDAYRFLLQVGATITPPPGLPAE